ncbi:DNA alkylation repair protein [Paenibacillus sp.]|uniref:DNA alkylation repair protein n=1 Tax=Paenibacillus sp. TaxID=58172 RepID=UPI002D70564E|nr:DNA alkylation repair protein [Paenibacillus sp.]HZG83348.1 DNA alkylation repair protein [Paenibacillus sp.]
MTYEEVMSALEAMADERTKRTYLNHGAKEPLFGVKIGDLKKLAKTVKKDQALAVRLFDSGNSDAMYLAALSIDPKRTTKEQLTRWVHAANWYMLAESAVAWVAAESPFALELARGWIEAEGELTAAAGWSVYASYLSIAPDETLAMDEIAGLLARARSSVHEERNRVRYAMNGFVIAVGCYVPALHGEAAAAAAAIGKVDVNVGNTACKVPLASEYIEKVARMGRVGQKKKTCIC